MSIPFNPITISVGKKSLSSFISLQIEQNIGKHHRFQMSVELESGGNRYVHNISENSKKWLGESIVVKAANKPIFVGVVTNVQLHREGSDFGCIIVSGYSATYRMETAHSCFSWNDRTIGDVVKKLCEQAKVQLELNPAFKETKDFICQYEESDFDFIRRLAHQYQEWMYFDGTKLIFGKPRKLADPIRLEYGTTLSSLDIGLQTLARSEQVFSYHSGADREMQRMTPDLAYGHDKLAGEAFRASLGMFSKPARQHALPRISNETELINYMGRKQAAETAETHYITAESQVPTLRVGSVVSLYSSFLERVGNLSEESLGDFIIIEITHEVSQGSYYKNRFKAIPATLKALPSPKVRMPLAETQMATVLSNADPEGKGRVRVRMNWQTEGMQTSWVRVMTPDGGSSSDVKSNRGFVFIPEVGDQVLLGFRHGDPARPYVMGSLFNGVTGGGGGNSNAIKSITTRSGIQIKLDDNGKSLHIQDASGNVVDMDGKGSMVVNAPNNIQLNATNIDITASNNINMSSGGNLITNVGANWLINVGKIINSMASYMRSTVAFSQKMFSGTLLWSSREDMKLQSEDITAIGTKKMFLHSEKEFLANSRGTLEMKSDGALSLLPKADKAKTEDHASITMAMVEFRTTKEYDGSFGFDWLRVDDNGLEKEGHYLYEEPYDKIIEGGYNDGKTDLTKDEAYKKLKKEYETIVVNMPDIAKNKKRAKEYFVPYLTLYPKPYVDSLKDVEEYAKPKYEAKLRVLVDIAVDEVDSLEFKYNKDIFDLDNTKLSDKNKTPKGKVQSNDKTVKITCKKEIIKASEGEIFVYAYPKEAAGKTVAERESMRTLAGKIRVLPNGKEERKRQNIVLVQVKTKPLSTDIFPRVGKFDEKEIILLHKIMHQSLIECDILRVKKGPDGKDIINPNSGKKMKIELDLTSDSNFKVESIQKKGRYISKDGNFLLKYDPYGSENLVKYLRREFLKVSDNHAYQNSFTVFAVDHYGGTAQSKILGYTDAVWKLKINKYILLKFLKNIILFKNRNTADYSTLPHETLHGLGLSHTHRNDSPISEKSRKYIYVKNETDNVMSYNTNNMISTWKWQWEFVKGNI